MLPLLLLTQIIAAQYVCPAGANATILKVEYNQNPTGDLDKADIDLYLYTLQSQAGQPAQDVPVKNGLVFLVSGFYVPGQAYHLPTKENLLQNHVCRMTTDDRGKISLKDFPSPKYSGDCVTHKFIFCPVSANMQDVKLGDAAQTNLAKCAQLVDAQNNLIKKFNWQDVPVCPSAPNANPYVKCDMVNGKPVCTDYVKAYDTTRNQVQACGTLAASKQQQAVCLSAGILFGLLFAASFMTGRNPLMFFDFGAARSIGTRMGTTQGPPPMQQYAFTPPIAGLFNIVDRAVNMVAKGDASTKEGYLSSKIMGSKEENKDEKGNDKTSPADRKGLMGQALDKIGVSSIKGDPKLVGALGTAARGVAVGAGTAGLVGLVNMAGGRKAVGKKMGKAALSASLPYLMSAAGQATMRGVQYATTDQMKNSPGVRSEQGRPKGVKQDAVFDGVKKAVAEKYGIDVKNVEIKPSSDPEKARVGMFDVVVNSNGKSERIGGLSQKADGGWAGAFTKPGSISAIFPSGTVHVLNIKSEGGKALVSLDPVIGTGAAGYSQFIGGRMQTFSGMGVLSGWTDSMLGSMLHGEFKDALKIFFSPITGLYGAVANSVSGDAPSFEINNARQTLNIPAGANGTPGANLVLTGGNIVNGKDSSGNDIIVGTYNTEGPLKLHMLENVGDLKKDHDYQYPTAGGWTGDLLLGITSYGPLAPKTADNSDNAFSGKGLVDVTSGNAPEKINISDALRNNKTVTTTINGETFAIRPTAPLPGDAFTQPHNQVEIVNNAGTVVAIGIEQPNHSIKWTDPKTGEGVKSITAGNATYPISQTDASAGKFGLLNYGEINSQKASATPWTADFYNHNGERMYRTDADGNKTNELVSNYREFMEETFWKQMDKTMDGFMTNGFSQGWLGMDKWMKARLGVTESGGYKKMLEDSDLTSVIVNSAWTGFGSQAVSGELMRPMKLTEKAQEEEEREQRVWDKRYSDEQKKNYEQSGFEDVKKEILKERKEKGDSNETVSDEDYLRHQANNLKKSLEIEPTIFNKSFPDPLDQFQPDKTLKEKMVELDNIFKTLDGNIPSQQREELTNDAREKLKEIANDASTPVQYGPGIGVSARKKELADQINAQATYTENYMGAGTKADAEMEQEKEKKADEKKEEKK